MVNQVNMMAIDEPKERKTGGNRYPPPNDVLSIDEECHSSSSSTTWQSASFSGVDSTPSLAYDSFSEHREGATTTIPSLPVPKPKSALESTAIFSSLHISPPLPPLWRRGHNWMEKVPIEQIYPRYPLFYGPAHSYVSLNGMTAATSKKEQPLKENNDGDDSPSDRCSRRLLWCGTSVSSTLLQALPLYSSPCMPASCSRTQRRGGSCMKQDSSWSNAMKEDQDTVFLSEVEERQCGSSSFRPSKLPAEEMPALQVPSPPSSPSSLLMQRRASTSKFSSPIQPPPPYLPSEMRISPLLSPPRASTTAACGMSSGSITFEFLGRTRARRVLLHGMQSLDRTYRLPTDLPSAPCTPPLVRTLYPNHDHSDDNAHDDAVDGGESENKSHEQNQPSDGDTDQPAARGECFGALLAGFLKFWGDSFQAGEEGFSVDRGGCRFALHPNGTIHGLLPHPQASDPVVRVLERKIIQRCFCEQLNHLCLSPSINLSGH